MGPFPTLKSPTATLLMIDGLKLPDGRTVHPPLATMETIEREVAALLARDDDLERIETTTWAEAMRNERSFIEVPPATETVTRTLEAQDYLDGAALRRLPDEGWHLVPERGRFYIEVEHGIGPPSRYYGATIAEAASHSRVYRASMTDEPVGSEGSP